MTWVVAAESVHGADSAALLRTYMADVASRYYRRPATGAEVDAALAEDPSDHLAPPRGVFLVLRNGTRPVGCVGLHRLTTAEAELNRLYVMPDTRGMGAGRRLLAAVEEVARDWGVAAIRLDTRHDLVEARGLYASVGYVEIPAYNAGKYAEHWFQKQLT